MLLGLLALLVERDAHLLRADRIDVVVELQHLVLPFARQWVRMVARAARQRCAAERPSSRSESRSPRHGVSDATYAAIASMSPLLNFSTTCCISAAEVPTRSPFCMFQSWRTI